MNRRPPYVDPQTNINYDVSGGEFEGWLTKKSMWWGEWRRRYFILKGTKLFFAKKEYTSPHGMIDLAHCTTVKSADLKTSMRNSFEISTPEVTYLLYADTEKDKDDWIGSVGRAIVRCSSTYTREYRDNQTNNGSGGDNNENGYGNNDEDSDDSDYSDDPNNPYFN